MQEKICRLGWRSRPFPWRRLLELRGFGPGPAHHRGLRRCITKREDRDRDRDRASGARKLRTYRRRPSVCVAPAQGRFLHVHSPVSAAVALAELGRDHRRGLPVYVPSGGRGRLGRWEIRSRRNSRSRSRSSRWCYVCNTIRDSGEDTDTDTDTVTVRRDLHSVEDGGHVLRDGRGQVVLRGPVVDGAPWGDRKGRSDHAPHTLD